VKKKGDCNIELFITSLSRRLSVSVSLSLSHPLDSENQFSQDPKARIQLNLRGRNMFLGRFSVFKPEKLWACNKVMPIYLGSSRGCNSTVDLKFLFFWTGSKTSIDNKLEGKYNRRKANNQPDSYKHTPVGPR